MKLLNSRWTKILSKEKLTYLLIKHSWLSLASGCHLHHYSTDLLIKMIIVLWNYTLHFQSLSQYRWMITIIKISGANLETGTHILSHGIQGCLCSALASYSSPLPTCSLFIPSFFCVLGLFSTLWPVPLPALKTIQRHIIFYLRNS